MKSFNVLISSAGRRVALLRIFREALRELGLSGKALATDASTISGAFHAADGERLTRLGNLLRRWSLDELLQFWSVLRGEMSLVGPRPLLMEYLDLYTPEQARRHDVKPGITGWAQICGRNAISWEEKFALDCWYVAHWSLWLDLRILLATVWKVVRCRGISAESSATMFEFQGSAPVKIEGDMRWNT